MATEHPDSMVRCLRRLIGVPVSDRSDGDLLAAFAATRDELAFEMLVDRYGPLVRGVCQRVLGNSADADDAFQAVFLVLVRQPGAIRQQDAVAAWLHGVALRVAHKLRVARVKRGVVEREAGQLRWSSSADDMSVRELKQVLDEELGQLADKYRAPLILCCLEGKSRDEAAAHLGWSIGSVKGRLERGRELLRSRLAQRGLAFSTALLAMTQDSASAAVPAGLAAATTQAALQFAVGRCLVGLVSPETVSLANEALRVFLISRVKRTALVLILSLALAGTGAGVVANPFAPDSVLHLPVAVEDPLISPMPIADALVNNDADPAADAASAVPETVAEPNPPEKPPARSRTAVSAISANGKGRSVIITSSSSRKGE